MCNFLCLCHYTILKQQKIHWVANSFRLGSNLGKPSMVLIKQVSVYFRLTASTYLNLIRNVQKVWKKNNTIVANFVRKTFNLLLQYRLVYTIYFSDFLLLYIYLLFNVGLCACVFVWSPCDQHHQVYMNCWMKSKKLKYY